MEAPMSIPGFVALFRCLSDERIMIEQCPSSAIISTYSTMQKWPKKFPYPSSQRRFPFTPLLKHLPIRPLICLSPLLDRLVPAPLVFQKLLVFRFLWVQLGEAIALVIRRNVKGGLLFLAADDEGTADDTVVSFAVDRRAAEDIFARGFEASEETTCGALVFGFRFLNDQVG